VGPGAEVDRDECWERGMASAHAMGNGCAWTRLSKRMRRRDW
jgi:hypothetical protein